MVMKHESRKASIVWSHNQVNCADSADYVMPGIGGCEATIVPVNIYS